MTQSDSEPVACTLTDEQAEQRPEVVQSVLISKYAGYDELENGVRVWFDGTDESLHAVAWFASNELDCCSFATYEITVSPPYNQTILTITGPDGTRELFSTGFIERLKAKTSTVPTSEEIPPVN